MYYLVVALYAFAGLAFAADDGASVYRWVDEQGVVHYSDRPQSSGARAVTVGTSPASDREDGRAGAAATAQTSSADRAAAVRAEECEKAKQRLASYRQAERLTTVTEDGETRDLTAEERVQAIVRAEEDVAALCSET